MTKNKYTFKEQKQIVSDFFKLRKKNVQSNTKRKIQREEDRSKRSSKSDV